MRTDEARQKEQSEGKKEEEETERKTTEGMREKRVGKEERGNWQRT